MNQSGNLRLTVASLLRHTLEFAAGSALILQEKTQAFSQEAFERGKEAQDQGRKLVQEMRAERKQRTLERAEPRELNIDFALDRLSVPTRADIQELNQRITELTHRIDELQEATE
jgi:polyhydroxyalkanoate synthesis regulator phasin